MKILETYTLSGNPIKHNEDRIGITDNMAWILDGSTPMQETIKNDYNSDAAWFVHCFDSLLRKHTSLGLQYAIKKSLEEISLTYKQNQYNNINLQEYLMPSSTFVGVEYCKQQNIIKIGFICDSRILVKFKNGNVTKFSETLLDQLDNERLRVTYEREKQYSKPINIKDRSKLTKDLRRKNMEKYCNKKDGYFVLTPSLACYELNGIQFNTFNANEIESILLGTDGLFSIVEKYNLMNYKEMFDYIESRSIAHLTQLIRTIEENDPNGEKYYRLKKSDDTSGVLISFVDKK